MINYKEITPQQPVLCKINQEALSVSVYGRLDGVGVLSHIVGLISLQGLEIIRAQSNTITDGEKVFFYDEFSIKITPLTNETWVYDLPQTIVQEMVLYTQDIQKAKQKIIEKISVDLAQKSNEETTFPVIDITITKKERGFFISIQGEDTPFLLYLLTRAIDIQGLSIARFFIDTKQGVVEDTFEVQTTHLFHQKNLAQLRFRLMLNTLFTFFLKNAPNPGQALNRFQEVIHSFELEEDTKLLDLLLHNTENSKTFARLLGSGDLLWEEFIRAQATEVVKIFSDSHTVFNIKSLDYEQQLIKIISEVKSYPEKMKAINTFKDKTVYDIDLEVMIKYKQDVKELSKKLSLLARVVIRHTCEVIEAHLITQYGVPRSSIHNKSDWVMYALGKFGGDALGYASDIEVMLIYEDKGFTDGSTPISNRQFFEFFMLELKKNILSRKDGIFTIDLRLRPHGESGPLAVTLSNFIAYYRSKKAHSVEILALTRMRPIAGNPRLAGKILRIKNDILSIPNIISREAIFETREKQIKEKVIPHTRNAKFGRGALASVEYNVQILQVHFGHKNPLLQKPSILAALHALSEIGEISSRDAEMLTKAYLFFRKLINALRMRRGNAQDLTLPSPQSWEIEHLARRMGYESKTMSEGEQLIFDFDVISAQVNAFVSTYFENVISSHSDEITNPARLAFIKNEKQAPTLLKNFNSPQHALGNIQKCARSGEIQELFSQVIWLGWVRLLRSGEPDWVLLAFERLTTGFSDATLITFYSLLLNQPKNISLLIDVFSVSKFLSDEIIKKPAQVFYLIGLQDMHRRKQALVFSQELQSYFATHSAVQKKKKEDLQLQRKNIIREFRKQEMLRIITRDICLKYPLSHICVEISNLAIALIQTSFFFACEDHAFEETQDVVVFAAGKLGSKELNYSSDIDLICVYKKNSTLDPKKLMLVVKRMIQYLSDYTSSGQAYRVDLRLRPFGDDGDIISTDEFLYHYYQKNARLWEIQATLKLSCVAGNEDFATTCYNRIVEINKERLAQYTHKDLLRITHTQRERSVAAYNVYGNAEMELKNSWGGIRDIEFSTQALQLLHYDSTVCGLSTLQALDFLENKTIITEQQKKKRVDCYLFLRKVEHFLQVHEDRQIHEIPTTNKTVIRRLSWFLLQEIDEDTFLQKLKTVKCIAHEQYCEVFESQ